MTSQSSKKQTKGMRITKPRKAAAVVQETSLRPASANPQQDIEDALKKFRVLRSRSLTVFKLLYPEHAVWRFRHMENAIPGIPPGQVFVNRQELFIVGLHGQLHKGIHSKRIVDADGKRVSIAISVVSAGMYEDDEDEGKTIYYTGEGGNDWGRSGKQICDQKLTSGGNGALLNSIRVGNAVRVIRRYGAGYCYSGLYQVKERQLAKGKSDFMVYRFKLTFLSSQVK